MIPREKNPEYLNSFLDYSITILNKSPNSVKEYNYDLTNFLKFMMIRFKLVNTDIYDEIDITSFTESNLKKSSNTMKDGFEKYGLEYLVNSSDFSKALKAKYGLSNLKYNNKYCQSRSKCIPKIKAIYKITGKQPIKIMFVNNLILSSTRLTSTQPTMASNPINKSKA